MSDILIVDDEADIRALVADILHDEGHATREAEDADGALAQVAADPPALIILDICWPFQWAVSEAPIISW